MFSVNNSTRDLSEAGIDTAILSVGATEQCGPHLPLNIDTLLAEHYARAWGEVLGAYVLPTVPFNTSEEHASFKGTVSLHPSTLMLVLEEVVGELRIQGFRKQVLTVGHGGVLRVGAFVKHVNRRFGDVVVVDAHRGSGPIWERALRKSGLAGRGEVHGGAVSRALALYLARGSVRGVRHAGPGTDGSLRRLRRVGAIRPRGELGPLRAGEGRRDSDGRGRKGTT